MSDRPGTGGTYGTEIEVLRVWGQLRYQEIKGSNTRFRNPSNEVTDNIRMSPALFDSLFIPRASHRTRTSEYTSDQNRWETLEIQVSEPGALAPNA